MLSESTVLTIKLSLFHVDPVLTWKFQDKNPIKVPGLTSNSPFSMSVHTPSQSNLYFKLWVTTSCGSHLWTWSFWNMFFHCDLVSWYDHVKAMVLDIKSYSIHHRSACASPCHNLLHHLHSPPHEWKNSSSPTSGHRAGVLNITWRSTKLSYSLVGRKRWIPTWLQNDSA